jgi:hypothetical protein
MEKQFLLRQDCVGAILGTLGLIATGCARLSSPRHPVAKYASFREDDAV